MERPSYRLEQFEGPLDLLLYLITKHKVDILEIEIAVLVDQYLAFMNQMAAADMEIASEFLEMASRLIYLKTISLLPRHEEEQQELTRQLAGELLEYGVCKEIAAWLEKEYQGDILFSRPPEKILPDKSYRITHMPQELLSAYLAAIGKGGRKLPPSTEAFRPLVSRRVVSVSSRITVILTVLYEKNDVPLEELFALAQDRSELVATFLAALELIKEKRVWVQDNRLAFAGKGGDAPNEEAQ